MFRPATQPSLSALQNIPKVQVAKHASSLWFSVAPVLVAKSDVLKFRQSSR